MAAPFSEGFLDTIVGVHWRSGPPPIPKFSWIAIEQLGLGNAFVTTTFTVNIAGVGSFQPFSGTQNGAGWASYMHPTGVISGGMLNGSLNPSGGVASINGFGQNLQQPFAIPHTFLFFKLDDKLPSKPFTVTVTSAIASTGPITPTQSLSITATVMKKIVEGDTIYPPTITSQVVVTKMGVNPASAVFLFDPKKLKVTGG